MSVTLFASGTQTATVTTEHSLASVNLEGMFQFSIDLVNMADGDVTEIRVYRIELTSGTKRLAKFYAYYGAQPSYELIFDSPFFQNDLTDANSLELSLKQTFGTGRNYPWKAMRDTAVQATVNTRTLDVSATGEAGIDWANIGSPTTAQNLSGTNIDPDQVVASVSGAVGSVTGNVGGSVASVATGGITAASIADNAIDTATFAAGTTIPRVTLADTVTTYTGNTPQTGDSFARIGATGSGLTTLATAANLATAVGFIDTEVASILSDTNAILIDTAEIGTAGAGLTNINLPNQTMDIVGNITGNLSGSVGSVSGAVGSVTGAVGSVTGNVGGNVVGTVASVVGNVSGNVVGSVGSVAGAVGSVTGNVGGSVASVAANGISASSLATDAVNEITAAIQALVLETGLTWQQALQVIAASVGGKLSGAATTTIAIKNAVADDKTRITATVDSDGNRTAIVYDLS